jgi:hypothetical protein
MSVPTTAAPSPTPASMRALMERYLADLLRLKLPKEEYRLPSNYLSLSEVEAVFAIVDLSTPAGSGTGPSWKSYTRPPCGDWNSATYSPVANSRRVNCPIQSNGFGCRPCRSYQRGSHHQGAAATLEINFAGQHKTVGGIKEQFVVVTAPVELRAAGDRSRLRKHLLDQVGTKQRWTKMAQAEGR